LPQDFHNLFVLCSFFLLVAWSTKVLYQFIHVCDISSRMVNSVPLRLNGMSLHAEDFKRIIRQHFNQILRMRRTVPPKPVARHQVLAHLIPETISIIAAPDGSIGLRFEIDATVPTTVKVYWGMPAAACNDFVQHQSSSAGPPTPEPSVPRRSMSFGMGRWNFRGSQQDSAVSLLEMEQLPEIPRDDSPRQLEGLRDSCFDATSHVSKSAEQRLGEGRNVVYESLPGDYLRPQQLASFDAIGAWLRPGTAAPSNPGAAPGHLLSGNAPRLPGATPGVLPGSAPRARPRRLSEEVVNVLPIVIILAVDPGHVRRGSRNMDMEGAALSGSSVTGEISIAKFKKPERDNEPPKSLEVVRQLVYGEGMFVQEVNGIYGFEDENDTECMICYARMKNVLLLPCRHCSVCQQCLRSLRDEKCPLCRSIFTSYVSLPVLRGAPPRGPANAAAAVVPKALPVTVAPAVPFQPSHAPRPTQPQAVVPTYTGSLPTALPAPRPHPHPQASAPSVLPALPKAPHLAAEARVRAAEAAAARALEQGSRQYLSTAPSLPAKAAAGGGRAAAAAPATLAKAAAAPAPTAPATTTTITTATATTATVAGGRGGASAMSATPAVSSSGAREAFTEGGSSSSRDTAGAHGGQAPPQGGEVGSVQPRQARDVQLGRPRGGAPGRRISGRRFADKMEAADTPLLREVTPQGALPAVDHSSGPPGGLDVADSTSLLRGDEVDAAPHSSMPKHLWNSRGRHSLHQTSSSASMGDSQESETLIDESQGF